MVLETTFRTPTGALTLVDAMSMGEGVREHELGHDSPHVVVRRLTCTEGTVQVDIEYTPRPEYGLIYPILTAADGVVSARGGADALTLECPVRLELRDSTARGRISMQGGESVAFALHDRRSWEAPSTPWGQEGIARQLDDTIAALAVLVRPAPGVRGTLARPSAPERPRAAGGRCSTPPPERSWRHRRPRCPKRSGASATGTTAMRGCVTRA